MTRKEALAYFKRHYLYCAEGINKEAEEMAIKALEQESYDDAISRQAVLKNIKNLYPDMPIVDIMGARQKWLEKYAPYRECEKMVEHLPPVVPQPKIGHWLKDSKGTSCSICRGYAIDDEGLDILTDYCPWCGAKMEVESEE